ncbi:dual specificity protein phosphatase family protein [Undibacterium sp. Ji49W]|uniref:dual specificity protein phosphatase family protein n=1 Tax=Undibacterium sp. Ji49W TaxID=3413040 RepID=UPI003BF2A31F
MTALSISLPASAAIAEDARPAEWASPVATTQNLFRVTPVFYRSAQLQSKDLGLLQALGIKTVVSLRSFHSDDKVLKNSGIKLQRIGINTWDINDKNVIAALRALQAAEKDGPVLLHCMHGADRTGLVTAMYRILNQGWTKDQALEELTKGGYGYHSLWKNIPDYLHKVDIDKIRQAVVQP